MQMQIAVASAHSVPRGYHLSNYNFLVFMKISFETVCLLAKVTVIENVFFILYIIQNLIFSTSLTIVC